MKKFVYGCAAALCAMSGLAHAQGFSVVYAFQGGSDGASPVGSLTADRSGNIYGVTQDGGNGRGTVFKITPQGVESVLYAFANGSDGASPVGPLRLDKQGNIYGVASLGYFGSNCPLSGGSGCGTVFKLSSGGTFNALHGFTQDSVTDGFYPASGLGAARGGTRYGTTLHGGSGCTTSAYGCGTIYSIKGTIEKVLYSFLGSDGYLPYATPIADDDGNLYGTAYFGGDANSGSVYKLSPAGNLTVLHSFTDGADGANPEGGLVMDKAGNLYGTTSRGGQTSYGNGSGTIFKLAPDGTFITLYTFTGAVDGGVPLGTLVLDGKGRIYGTASQGGNKCFGGASSCGVVFALNRNGSFAVLHAFTGGTDGAYPQGSLRRRAGGYLWGATLQGGNLSCAAGGCGTVFRIAPFP